MFTISKSFSFSAAHQLTHLPDGHPCARPHGHNYEVVVVLAGQLNAAGMVMDYNDLKVFKDYLDACYDHRDLNVVCGGGEWTTAERLAQRFHTWLSQRFPLVVAVQVSETPKTMAEYRV